MNCEKPNSVLIGVAILVVIFFSFDIWWSQHGAGASARQVENSTKAPLPVVPASRDTNEVPDFRAREFCYEGMVYVLFTSAGIASISPKIVGTGSLPAPQQCKYHGRP